MKKIQRYDVYEDDDFYPPGSKSDSGEWCKWEDVEKLQRAAHTFKEIIIKNSRKLDADFARIINEDFWDLV